MSKDIIGETSTSSKERANLVAKDLIESFPKKQVGENIKKEIKKTPLKDSNIFDRIKNLFPGKPSDVSKEADNAKNIIEQTVMSPVERANLVEKDLKEEMLNNLINVKEEAPPVVQNVVNDVGGEIIKETGKEIIEGTGKEAGKEVVEGVGKEVGKETTKAINPISIADDINTLVSDDANLVKKGGAAIDATGQALSGTVVGAPIGLPVSLLGKLVKLGSSFAGPSKNEKKISCPESAR